MLTDTTPTAGWRAAADLLDLLSISRRILVEQPKEEEEGSHLD